MPSPPILPATPFTAARGSRRRQDQEQFPRLRPEAGSTALPAPGPPPLPHPLVPRLEQLAREVAEQDGMDVQEVRLHTHRIPLTVQVLVRRADGGDISLEHCAALSGPLSVAIETSGLLTSSYVLEVSSPGIGEDLLSERDFMSFRGFPVEVLHRPSPGSERRSEGLLQGRDDEAVLLNARGRSIRIPRQEVVAVRLVSPRGAG